MSAQPHDHEQPQPQFAPLDAELTFTVQAEILGIRGPLEIRAQRVSSIQRVLRLLKQNHVLIEIEHEQASSSDEAPICPMHQKPMKKGQYGWFCPRKTEDGEYCKERVKS
jgi:hypothetical protein